MVKPGLHGAAALCAPDDVWTRSPGAHKLVPPQPKLLVYFARIPRYHGLLEDACLRATQCPPRQSTDSQMCMPELCRYVEFDRRG